MNPRNFVGACIAVAAFALGVSALTQAASPAQALAAGPPQPQPTITPIIIIGPRNPFPRPTPTAAYQGPPIVGGVEVKFHTNDDDKDGDTVLVTTVTCGAQLLSSSDLGLYNGPNPGLGYSPSGSYFSQYAFSDNAETPWIPIGVKWGVRVLKSQIHDCVTTVHIQPNGHDTWRFNYWIRLTYTDGTHDEYHHDRQVLSQDRKDYTVLLR